MDFCSGAFTAPGQLYLILEAAGYAGGGVLPKSFSFQHQAK